MLSTSDAPSGFMRILSLRGKPARVLPVRGLSPGVAHWTHDGRGLICRELPPTVTLQVYMQHDVTSGSCGTVHSGRVVLESRPPPRGYS